MATKIHATRIDTDLLKALDGQQLHKPVTKLLRELYDVYIVDDVPKHHEIDFSKHPNNDLYCELQHFEKMLGVMHSILILQTFKGLVVHFAIQKNEDGTPLFNPMALHVAYNSLNKTFGWFSDSVLSKIPTPTFATHEDKYGSDLGFLKFWAKHRKFAELKKHYGNKELIKSATEGKQPALKLAPPKLKKDKAFIEELSVIWPPALSLASPELAQDESFLLKIAAQNLECLQYADDTVYKKYGLRCGLGRKEEWERFYAALESGNTKDDLENVITPKDESVQDAKARRKRQTGM